MATTSSLFMYSLTIQPPTAITQAILGQFSGTKEQQIVTASGSKLTIHRPDAQQGKVSAVFSQDCFGIIRTLAAFRLAGSNKGTLRLPSFYDALSDVCKLSASVRSSPATFSYFSAMVRSRENAASSGSFSRPRPRLGFLRPGNDWRRRRSDHIY